MPSETAANDGRIDLFGVSSVMLQYNWSGGRERTLVVELTAGNAEAPVIGFLFAFYSISSIFTPLME